jgi:hypothetical protein
MRKLVACARDKVNAFGNFDFVLGLNFLSWFGSGFAVYDDSAVTYQAGCMGARAGKVSNYELYV